VSKEIWAGRRLVQVLDTLFEKGACYWQGVYIQKWEEGKDERGRILAEAVVQACRTDILVHIIIKVCPLARLATYLSLVRFLS